MNTLSRTITGGIMMLGGIILMLIPLFVEEKEAFFTWIYGIPLLIIGLFILFNKREDVIEQIGERRVKKK